MEDQIMMPATSKTPNHGRSQYRPSTADFKTRRNRSDSCKLTPVVSGHELSDLLSPITPATFTSEYWGRKALLIKGHPDKLQKLVPGGFDRADFFRAVREAAAKKIKDFGLYAGRPERREPYAS